MGEQPIDRVLSKLPGARRSGGAWAARCPAHEDRNPSLSVAVGRAENVLLKCHAGCSIDAVLAAMELELPDLFVPQVTNGQRAELVATYPYVDEDGELLFTVERWAPKRFSQRPANGKTGAGAMDGVRRVPYRLPSIIDATAAGQTVYIVEGEKDADVMARAGHVATCNPGGALKWPSVAAPARKALQGARVVVVADKDEPGYAHASQVADSLAGVAASIEVVQAAKGKDASDHLLAGFGVDQFEPVDANEPVADVGPEPGATWRAVELGPIVDGTAEPRMPTKLARADGNFLFYPATSHTVNGPSEGGKSWLVQYAAAQELDNGGVVAWFDFEDNEDNVTRRMLALGVPGGVVRDQTRFRYVRPDEALFARSRSGDVTPTSALAVFDETLAGASLVVVDGFNEALALHGLSMNDAIDVASAQRYLFRRAATNGSAVIGIDHVSLAATTATVNAIGSQHKRAGVDVTLMVDPLEPYGIGLTGSSIIRVTKDRPGRLRPVCGDAKRERWGHFFLGSGPTGQQVWPRIDLPPDLCDDYGDEGLLQSIAGAALAEPGLTLNQLMLKVKGNRERKRSAVDELIVRGQLREEPGPRNSRLIFVKGGPAGD